MVVNRAYVEAKVKEIVVDNLEILNEDYNIHSSFVRDFDVDSLDVAILVLEAEKAFEIEIPDDLVEKVKTPLDAVNTIIFILEREQ